MKFPSALFAMMALAAFPAMGADAPGNGTWPPSATDKVVNISGVYPHLTVFNADGECGIGAIVPWAEKLWFITYPPHRPEGSTDGLYTIDKDLRLELRPESVGGTHANRMIHDESHQLILGPYFISADGKVRAADIHQLRARLTATTRHLTDPANKVFMFGMERQLFEVDVNTLAVTKIYGEMKGPFPGYHGKGAIVAQGKLIVADNGETGWNIAKDTHFNGPAGCLAESDGRDWTQPFHVIERKNFTEVTGPGGLHGFAAGDSRVWTLGWDKRSVILKLLEDGQWHDYRLPKGSYSHDALHGWYTEWPRIREVTEGHWLMHMHGLFYEFPKAFSARNAGGIRPLSTYLKMPVDYCAWQGGIVMTCDDASVMQNPLAGQSNSNVRFLKWEDLSKIAPPAGWGGVWVDDEVKAGEPSAPFLVSGFSAGVLHLRSGAAEPVTFVIEADAKGNGEWMKAASVTVSAHGALFHVLEQELSNAWLRLVPERDASGVTAYFNLTNPARATEPNRFAGLADVTEAQTSSEAALRPGPKDARRLFYSPRAGEMTLIDGSLSLRSAKAEEVPALPEPPSGDAVVSQDSASVIVTEHKKRFRLPIAAPEVPGQRHFREVVTERDILNAGGTFYESPRDLAGRVRRLRPISSHNKAISDFCSWRGLLVMANAKPDAQPGEHIIRSEDGKSALWLGEVDDLWRLGAPRGVGGPWKDSAVAAGSPSDPYLMAGYGHKSLRIAHDSREPVTFTVEVDVLADGSFSEYARFQVEPGQPFDHEFPEGYSAHWVRLIADKPATVSAMFTYGPK